MLDPGPTPYPDVMDVMEAARFLGKTPAALRWLAQHGKVPAAKVGLSWRFSKAALLVFLEGRRAGSDAQK